MDEGTPQGENGELKNNAGDDEVTRLRKERDQAQMRANQLENERKDREKLDEEARQAKLKENEEYKTLHEQSEAKRKEAEAALLAIEQKATVMSAAEELKKGYTAEVLDLASVAGLELADASDEAKASYKEKLDALASRVTPRRSPVAGSNPAPPSAQVPERSEALTAMKVATGGENLNKDMLARAFHSYTEANPHLKSALDTMRDQAGVRR